MVSQISDSELDDRDEFGNKWFLTEFDSQKLPGFLEELKDGRYQPIATTTQGWNNQKKSRLIESFIINIPVPPVILYQQAYRLYEVIDGNQRINAINDFYKNRFQLRGLEFFPELEGCTYQTLPYQIQERLNHRRLSLMTIINESTSHLTEEQVKRLVRERFN